MNAANRQAGVNQIVLLVVIAVALAAAYVAIELYTGGEKDMLTVGKLILSELAPVVSAQHGVFYVMETSKEEAPEPARRERGHAEAL